VSAAEGAELVFVVDVSSFTKDGFLGSTTYNGKRVDLEFDDAGKGFYLTAAMAERLHVRKGSLLKIILEDDRMVVANTVVASVGKSIRISDPKVYYGVGKEGGAVIRIRKA
jgi:putative transposon-encoded protein